MSINRGLIRTFKYSKQPQLFIHELNRDLCKISFSSDPTALEVGTVPNPSLPKGMDYRFIVDPTKFKPNNDFRALFHQCFYKHVYDDITYQLDALNFRSSFLPIGDFKIVLRFMNQRPAFENTIGFVRVDDEGAMIRDSYQSNDIYELCNCDGMVSLSDYMLEQIKASVDATGSSN